ncbi:prolyl 3-hydroxylase 3-like isoform X1 [Branchiostoma floridae x Branchiostoma belcheri]
MEANEAAQLAQQGVVSVDSADKFLTLNEKARQFTHAYFGLEQELYIQFTHLVCRTAEPYSTDNRQDLSHKIHADSCELNFTDWTCKPYPSHSGPLHKRDYSSILFLNDGFKGGKFFFSDRNLTAEATVQPKCGRLVAFSSGPENPHGVQAVMLTGLLIQIIPNSYHNFCILSSPKRSPKDCIPTKITKPTHYAECGTIHYPLPSKKKPNPIIAR